MERMAMGGRMVVMALVMLAFMLVQVERTEAGYGSGPNLVKFTSTSGLQDVDTMSLYHEDAADEFLDEPTRRMLATKTYITYGALNGNRAPCPSTSAGRSYYTNCANTGPVSPYRRGCYQITRCARG